MPSMNVIGIILAAGLGKRMKSNIHKVLHPICGKPMVSHVIDALEGAGVQRKVVVVGHGAEAVRSALEGRAEFVAQEEQLGTGHAVRTAETLLAGEDGVTVVVYGDTPLLTSQTLTGMIELHKERNAAATVLTAELDNPAGLGRIVRGADGSIERIAEEKDASEEERRIKEINAGAYCFDNRKLFEALAQVKNENEQGEYYLTDVISIFRKAGRLVQAYVTADPSEAFGVNDRAALAEAGRLLRARINRQHMLNGVTIVDPASTYIDADVAIGQDTVVYPGTALRSGTRIGQGCVIGPNSDLSASEVADSAIVKHSVLDGAYVGARTTVGPFAYLRPGTRLGENVKIGDFVETKNAAIGDGTKVSHLAYVGDARIGKNVNIGCGVITVNYDGFSKSETIVEDEAFIGSNVNLVAPVRIGKGAFVVAGSTITKDVGEDDMAVARERQTNKTGYAKTLKARLIARKKNRQ